MLRRSIRFVIALLAHCFLAVGASAEHIPQNERPVVVLFIAANGTADAIWYDGIVENSQAAADALNLELEQIFAGTVRPKVLAALEQRLKQAPKPDYIVFGNQRGLGADMLKLTNDYEVNTFLYIAPLEDEDHARIGGPRASLPYWIGELIPDDEKAGYDLAQFLIEEARDAAKDPSRTIRMLGITGRRSTTSSAQRHRGLLRAVSEHDDVDLLQTVPGRWRRDVAKQKYKLLLNRYGDVDIVWAANDPMALGVVEAAQERSDDVKIGGVDWIPPALQALEDGTLVASMGGHNFDIAYVMALLRNHFDGHDFADIAGSPSLSSNLIPLTSENIAHYQEFSVRKQNSKIDFGAGLSKLVTEEGLENISITPFIENTMPEMSGTQP